MIKEKQQWGIDLIGRKMWYESWPIDKNEEYRNPLDKEKEEIYGMSGEAINETLLYFEECGGNTKKLIKLLNDHVIDSRFFIEREKLLDKTRWYTNEYYFYFIMFTKKVFDDYNWRFTKGEDVQLSIYHKIYEIGHLKFLPYGGEEKDDSYNLMFSAIQHYQDKYNLSDLYNWSEILVSEKTSISFKKVVSKLENYRLCSEFNCFLYEFLKILINKNSMKTISNEVFDSNVLIGFSYVPESMLIPIIKYLTQKTTNFFDIQIKHNKKNNSATFILKIAKDYNLKKDNIYQKANINTGNQIAIAAYSNIIKKLLTLDEIPDVKIVLEDTYYCQFTLKWKKRILSIPYLNLTLCNIFSISIIILNGIFQWNSLFYIILFFLPLNIVLIILRKLKIEKDKRKGLEEKVIKVTEDNTRRVEDLEKITNDLILEKDTLEENVKERTKDLAKANEKLKELDKAKTNFFANVSHELRTPLTLILGPLEMIFSGKYGKIFKYNDEKIELMLYNGTKLLKLINNLLDFTKIEVSRMSMIKQKIDILELLKFYVSTVKSLAENRGISIAFINNLKGSNKKSLIVNIDINLLEKAFFNLISNALKFTNYEGNIIIELNNTIDEFSISVIDNGIGIPENKLETIFERFNQIDGSSSRKYEGTGIGLALTKEIMKIMGGRITVKSKVSQGSKFTMMFPRDIGNIDDKNFELEKIQEVKSYLLSDLQSSINNDKEQEKKINNNQDKTILIVEDNIDMRKYLESILKSQYNILFAKDGKQGFEITKNEKPDLILADIMMPILDGYEMTSLIKSFEEYKGIPIILLTAKANKFMKIEGFEKGADDYIIKPFDAKELLSRIKAHLEMKKLRDKIIEQKRQLEKTIDEKIIVQKQLQESEKRFREMAENLPISIVEIDLNKKVNYLNQYTKKLFNLDYNDLLYEIRILDYVKQEERDKIKINFKKIYNGEDIGIYETKIITKRGNEISVLIKSNPIYKENRIIGLRSTIFEIKPEMNLTLLPDNDFYKKYRITNRERDVMINILKGYRNKDIGEKLFLSEIAIKKYVSNIYSKIEVKNRSELLKKITDY